MAKILIPYYRDPLTDLEQISLQAARCHFDSNSIIFIAPESLDISQVLRIGESAEHFSYQYFENIEGYNRLLTSSAFYERFVAWDYILIYQLDCLVFKNELDVWVSRGHDYIAAPWFSRFEPNPSEGLWRVGNGGFSLRNVHSHLRLLKKKIIKDSVYPKHGSTPWEPTEAMEELGSYQKLFPWHQKFNPFVKWVSLEEELQLYPHNEDLFWSLEAPKFDSSFKVATAEEALPFAFEMNPAWCFKKNGSKLPFGCHAWPRYDRAFWEKTLSNQYNIT